MTTTTPATETIKVIVTGLEYPPARITRWDTLESAIDGLITRVETVGVIGARGAVTINDEVAAIAEFRSDGVWLI